MKKLFILLFVFIAFQSFAQTEVEKVTCLKVELYNPNNSPYAKETKYIQIEANNSNSDVTIYFKGENRNGFMPLTFVGEIDLIPSSKGKGFIYKWLSDYFLIIINQDDTIEIHNVDEDLNTYFAYICSKCF